MVDDYRKNGSLPEGYLGRKKLEVGKNWFTKFNSLEIGSNLG